MVIGELKRSAKESLKGKWGAAIGVMLLYSVIPFVGGIAIGFSQVISMITQGGELNFFWQMLPWIFGIFVTLPLWVGLMWFHLNVYDGSASVKDLFAPFRAGYWRALGTYLLVLLFTFLWSLLFIIPGIIKSYSYAQALFLIKDNPEMGPLEAIRKSKQMMDGKKGKYFLTILSFLGWVAVPFGLILYGYVTMLVNIDLAGLAMLQTELVMIYAPEFILHTFGMMGLGYLILFALSFFLWPYFFTTLAGFYRKLTLEEFNEEMQIVVQEGNHVEEVF